MEITVSSSINGEVDGGMAAVGVNGGKLCATAGDDDLVGHYGPSVEVRFEHLTVEKECRIAKSAFPSIFNAAHGFIEALFNVRFSEPTRLLLLKDVSGVVKPSRMTLLIGPQSSGKTTLLKTLAGRLSHTLKASGVVAYNGYKLDEFVVEKTIAYVSEENIHIPELTVKETIEIAARCLDVGRSSGQICELVKGGREKSIQEVDDAFFMKAINSNGLRISFPTNYILKILDLENCANTIVGDMMRRGISGGEKRRLTTGEIIVGPMKVYIMDDILVGLDSSTAYKIVKCLQEIVYSKHATLLMSILQPTLQTFDLFDDIIIINEGHIVYNGPRDSVLHFFESCGFSCPERKSIVDFIHEVISSKDQHLYWTDQSLPYSYVSTREFANQFSKFHVGRSLKQELSIPFDKSRSHLDALVFEKKTVPYSHLLISSFYKEWLIVNRNVSLHVVKLLQMAFVAFVLSSMFLNTRLLQNSVSDGDMWINLIAYGTIVNVISGIPQIILTLKQLPVIYKHRDLLFYPPWIFTIPNFLFRIPISMLESFTWVAITYYSIGFAPEASRFFKQFLVLFLMQQVAAGMFRLVAAVFRTMIISFNMGILLTVIFILVSGIVMPKGAIPIWWVWGYIISPLTHGFNALAINEFLAPRWMNALADDGRSLGVVILERADIIPENKWYWIGVAIYLGYIFSLNTVFTLALSNFDLIKKSQAIVSLDEEVDSMKESNRSGGHFTKKGMIIPFTPLTITFNDVNYYVDMPKKARHKGANGNRLQLLSGVTGAFRPNNLTALMGISGAGKTTLLDVLSGRKTSGHIEGDIKISGHEKVQKTFTRISGYCEQSDIHSPYVTVKESMIYSAFLRLPNKVKDDEKMKYVDEVIDLMELNHIKDTIVGLPGVMGLSTEQRKRLTMAVELVANPSIIFMDEPTSGLDARASAIVMRVVRNTVDTGRTVVCTIHQPSIENFEAFDELLLLKTGGQVIFYGPLGKKSRHMIDYFEAIQGVSKFQDNYNPATWMLEVSSSTVEMNLEIDFAKYYKATNLFIQTKEMINELSKQSQESRDFEFTFLYSHSIYEQFKCCLWRQWWTYWRNPDYNFIRFLLTICIAFIVGSIFWNVGQKRNDSNDINYIIGVMYIIIMGIGIINCSISQTIIAIERTTFYREIGAGMYSAFSYALAQVIIEIPYAFTQTLIYIIIIYPMIGFQWSLVKFMWFFYISFLSFLYFTYFGLMIMSLSPNPQVASIFAATSYLLFQLFSGFFIPKTKFPKWWIWYYWICPVSWTVYGLITTQYGDLNDMIDGPGKTNMSIKFYVDEHLGYHHDFMSVVSIVLALFSIVFAFTFAFCIKALNFQKR